MLALLDTAFFKALAVRRREQEMTRRRSTKASPKTADEKPTRRKVRGRKRTVVTSEAGGHDVHDDAPEKKRPGRKPKTLQEYDGPTFDMAAGTCCQQIQLEQLHVDDTTFQIRATTRPEFLVESIRSHGVLDPLVARPHPGKPGEYQLVSGFNRAKAAAIAGMESVPVTVKELSDQEAYIFAYAENENRQSLNDLDRACAIRKLRESGAAKTTGDVARLFRISERQVQRLEALLKYPKALQQAVADDEISATHALVLNQGLQKHKPDFDLGTWIKKTVEETLSVSELRDEIKKTFRRRTPKKQLLRQRGDLWIFNRKYLAETSAEARNEAIANLEKIIEELRS